jgi:hypothetical protein
MKAKKLIPLFVILAVLGALVVMKMANEKQPGIVEQVNLEALVPEGLETDDLVKVELYAGAKPEEKVVLEKTDGEWKVSSHFNAPVTEDTINEYLEKMTGLKGEYRTEAAEAEKLADFSLKEDEAFHVKAWKDADGEPVVDLLFGKAPDYKSVFVRKAGGERIYVEAANLRKDAGLYGDDMEKAPEASKWLDKEIVKLEDEEKEAINRIALTLPDKKLTLEKQAVEKEAAAEDDGSDEAGEAPAEETPAEPEMEWKLVEGGFAGQEAKDSAITNMVNKIASFMASDIVDPEKKAEWGLEEPAFEAVIAIEGKTDDILLKAGRPDTSGDACVSRADTQADVVYTVSKYDFERLFPKGSDLFALPGLTMNKEDLTRIEVRQPESTVILEKAGEDWNVVEPAADLDTQKSAVTNLVSAVSNWKPADYADAGTETGAFDTKIIVAGAEGTRTISIGGDAKSIDGVYAKLDGQESVLVMGRTDLAKVLVKPRDIYDMSALDINEADAAGVTINREDRTWELTRPDDGWKLAVDGADTPVNAEKADELLSLLAELQIADFSDRAAPVAEAETAPEAGVVAEAETEPEAEAGTGAETGPAPTEAAAPAPAPPYAAITVTMKDGAAHRIELSKPEDGVYYVRISGRANEFKIAAADIDAILNLLDQLKSEEQEEEEPAVEEGGEAGVVPVLPEGAAESSAPAITPAPIPVPLPKVTEPAPEAETAS